MDLSASNTGLWTPIIQIGFLCMVLLAGNALRRKIPFIRKTLLPTAVIAGFLALLVRQAGLVPIDKQFMESLTYHVTAIGFIAMSLRVPRRSEYDQNSKTRHDGVKSGIFIVCCYLVQGILGLGITAGLAYTFMPNLFKSSGLLLPLGYGQGPGQANNIGNVYEHTYNFAGGASFGLAVATMGFLWACIGGVIYLNYLVRKKGYKLPGTQSEYHVSESVADKGEIPLTDAVDKFTIQTSLVLFVYLITYLFSWGLCYLFGAVPFLKGLESTVVPLIWGFNFLFGSIFALLFRGIFALLIKTKLMSHQYPNSYLLNRIAGVAFDLMITASVCAIDIDDLKGLWIPFTLICLVGGLVTIWYVKKVSDHIYPEYRTEGMLAMYGMMTGTVSTGVLLLREVDPEFKTPAANNLIIGSSVAVAFGFPLLLMVGFAPRSTALLFITFGLMIIYAAVLNIILFKDKLFRNKKNKAK